VTAVSVSGEVVETELVAEFTSSPCCAGYEFPSTFIDIALGGSADAGASDGAPMGAKDAPESQ
jgi:hypothetical protein